MTEIPDRLVLRRHRDLEGRRGGIHWRRSMLVLLAAALVAGLFNVFGQRPSGAMAQSSAATLRLWAPDHLRGGLLYAATITVDARRTLRRATLVFSPGWVSTQQMNTIEPSPISQSSHDGGVAFLLGKIKAGSSYKLLLEFQVDPTSFGRRTADLTLYDGNARLTTIDRTLTFFP